LERKSILIEKHVNEVHIKLTSGAVKVVKSSDDSFKLFFEENAPDVRIDNDVLSINVRGYEKGLLGLINFGSGPSEHLELHVPTHLKLLQISSISADIKVSSLSFEHGTLKTVSGEIKIDGCRAQSVEIKTVSGDIELSTVDVQRLAVASASGDINVDKLECREYDWLLSTVSGDMSLNVVGLPNIRLSLKSTSGDISSNVGYVRRGNEYIFGDGRMKIVASTVSGDVRLKVMSKKERVEEIEKRILRLVAEGKLSYEEAKQMLQELS